jgi:hypothetical protein
LPGAGRKTPWEASGVLAKDRRFFVVFDDRADVACLADDLQPDSPHELLGAARRKGGFEGIAYNAAMQRFYLLVEAREHANGSFHAVAVECDDQFRRLKERPLDFTFKSDNKGFEAIAHARRDGGDYLLALCEGNKCKCGEKGRIPGGGRVQLFEKSKKAWRHVDAIPLPSTLPFVDYSGMSIADHRVAIVSQVNSMLWIGQFDESDWTWRDSGQLYEFPRHDDGSIRYGNIEGVSWITPARLVTVSDKRKKKDQADKRLADKDQAVHIFEIPS